MKIKIDKDNLGKRLDVVIAEQLEKSRSHVQKLIKEEKILVNELPSKTNYKVQDKDLIQIMDEEPEYIEIKAQEMPLNIVFEDDYLLVVDKPSNLVVHPAPGHYDNTLVNGLMYHSKNLSNVNGEFRPGIVHRIDKDTSGLLVVAKTNEVHNLLSQMIRDREIKRQYKAIIHGALQEKEAKIVAPIGRDTKDRKKMTVTDKNSKEATTLVKLLDSNDSYSLVQCSLMTGRTHQIRVHLKFINHPVLGDPKYGPKKTIDTKGQALHAYKLEFIHPITKEEIKIISEIPKEFKESLDQVGLKDK